MEKMQFSAFDLIVGVIQIDNGWPYYNVSFIWVSGTWWKANLYEIRRKIGSRPNFLPLTAFWFVDMSYGSETVEHIIAPSASFKLVVWWICWKPITHTLVQKSITRTWYFRSIQPLSPWKLTAKKDKSCALIRTRCPPFQTRVSSASHIPHAILFHIALNGR